MKKHPIKKNKEIPNKTNVPTSLLSFIVKWVAK